MIVANCGLLHLVAQIDYECANFFIQIVLAAIGIAVVIVAIWGDWFQHLVASPRLVLRLRNAKGILTRAKSGPTRHYHLSVSNERIWAHANRVDIYLTKVEALAPSQAWETTYETGPIELCWQFTKQKQNSRYLRPMEPPRIGRECLCDLGSIKQGKGFELATQFDCYDLAKTIEAGEHVRLHLIAIADNGSSDPLILEVLYKGGWSEDTDEMARLLRITEVDDANVMLNG